MSKEKELENKLTGLTHQNEYFCDKITRKIDTILMMVRVSEDFNYEQLKCVHTMIIRLVQEIKDDAFQHKMPELPF